MAKVLSIVQKYYPDVQEVVDAKRNAPVTIVQEDCVKGKQLQPNNCAMARAFERSYDGAIISVSTAYLVRGNKAFRYRVPASVSREVIVFDRGQDFAPGTYKLLAPGPKHELGTHQGGNNSKKKKPRVGPAREYHRTSGIRSL